MGTDRQIKRIAVIGGGITGLAAAYRLRELAAAREFPLEVNLLERSTRCNGALETIRRDGFVIETGADSFISEKRACAELAARLGLGAELIPTREIYRKTCVVRAGRLDHIIEIDLPSPAELEGIFRHYLRGDLEGESLCSIAIAANGQPRVSISARRLRWSLNRETV